MDPILVVGSANTDLVATASRLPAPGETVMGGAFATYGGGKGANQAVAAARAGGRVAFLGAVGRDEFGEKALRALEAEGIDIGAMVQTDEAPSGVALIVVDKHGENQIVVAPGANHCLTPAHVDAFDFSPYKWVALQLEIRHDTAWRIVERAAEAGCRVVLNPAPAAHLPAGIVGALDTLVPNRTELEEACGMSGGFDTYEEIVLAAQPLFETGLRRLVVTLGAGGVACVELEEWFHAPAPRVQVVDTVGAGDCFIGALCAELAGGADTRSAVRFAMQAAALSVGRAGAQASMPRREEILSARFEK